MEFLQLIELNIESHQLKWWDFVIYKDKNKEDYMELYVAKKSKYAMKQRKQYNR